MLEKPLDLFGRSQSSDGDHERLDRVLLDALNLDRTTTDVLVLRQNDPPVPATEFQPLGVLHPLIRSDSLYLSEGAESPPNRAQPTGHLVATQRPINEEYRLRPGG